MFESLSVEGNQLTCLHIFQRLHSLVFDKAKKKTNSRSIDEVLSKT
jgi:hypothetical protein